MADRVRSIMKRSSSKLGVSRGSMSHLGTTPYKYKLDIFISHVTNVKTADEVCVVWERRGKVASTACVKVRDKKAVFRETLSMETTLFRKAAPGVNPGATPEHGETLNFDEKKAKFSLRRGGPEGKSLGKIMVNLSESIKLIKGSVFVDLKLSNESVVSTKIESTFLYIGKKKRGEDGAESDVCSEMTEDNEGMENDSIFGDDLDDLGDMEIVAHRNPDEVAGNMAEVSSSSMKRSHDDTGRDPMGGSVDSPVSSSSVSTVRSAAADEKGQASVITKPTRKDTTGLKESPSLRNKLKNKLTGKDKKEHQPQKDRKEDSHGREATGGKFRIRKMSRESDEMSELRRSVELLQSENKKLRASKQAAMAEIDALRAELQSCEGAQQNCKKCKELTDARRSLERRLRERIADREKRIEQLEAQNGNLVDQLEGEEVHHGNGEASNTTCKQLRAKVADLEIALEREPKYLDVVAELKVAKVSLALANMEKEQALFKLQQRG